MKISYTIFSFLILVNAAFTQTVTVFGVVRDAETNKPIDFATVYIKGTNNATETDQFGQYSFEVSVQDKVEIVFSRLGYLDANAVIRDLVPGSRRYINVRLQVKVDDLDIVIRGSRIEDGGMVREEVNEFKMLPSVSGNLESILPSIALGVSVGTGGELSSQYNVRGGNFDENLIYINDFEIFRPQLIRAGQQEGLSVPNIDLIRDLSFSSGGFESKYGDKMASVLDIRYKRPEETRGSVSGSLLGASAHVEGSKRLGKNAYNKLRYLAGARYKTTRYILGSLDVQGEYIPDFVDLQAYVTYDITKDIQLAWIGNYNYSRYDFIPATRSTALGLIDFALRLSTVFEGSQQDRFINGMTGFSLTYVPEKKRNPLYLKLMSSAYGSSEAESFDILGFYRLSQIESDFGSNEFGQEIAVLGTGTQHLFARNYLFYNIYNIEHRGGIEFNQIDFGGSNFVQWGMKYQTEIFDDRLNEWERLDSAGYSLPYTGEVVSLNQVFKSTNAIQNHKFSSFVQNTYTNTSLDKIELRVNGGVRFAYNHLGREFLISPRGSIEIKPLDWSSPVSFRVAGGVYYQPPLYREFRRFDGSLNTNLKSQKSTHLVGGVNYDFMWPGISKKPFRFISEVYYKKLENLVSYDVDIVRIRYSGENDAQGHAAGIDFRINGEFVPDAESWLSVSFLRTRENLIGIQHLNRIPGDSIFTEVPNVPRPTDRLVNINLFFQDYLKSNKNAKVFVNISYASGLPFGVPENNRIIRNNFRFKSYQRVDIGFSFKLWSEGDIEKRPNSPFRFTRDTWLSLEVFNLLDFANNATNTWIRTITNTQYAIPDNLTSRRLNLRFRMDL
jgi:hypothetical protein